MKLFDISKKELAFRGVKAALKGFLVYIVFFLFFVLIQPLERFLGKFNVLINSFLVIFIILTVLAEFFSKTILHYFFAFARDLTIMVYPVVMSEFGMIKFSVENILLTIDITTILFIVILISLISIAKDILGAIDFLNAKSEKELTIAKS